MNASERIMDSIRGESYIDETPGEFRVATNAYRDAEVFQAEIARIFSSSWIYLCHESEIPDAGDYKSTLLGLQPVIVSRDREGGVAAVLNACTHRGATLCRAEGGSAKVLVCPYHGWSFRPSGELVGIPAAERYHADFDRSNKDLVKVPRIAAYNGFVFGSLDPHGEDLASFLGEGRELIDRWVRRSAGGKIRLATPHRYAYPGNWKFQSENMYDGYHPGFVHRSAFNTMQKFAGSFDNRYFGTVRPDGRTRGFPGGHGTLEAGVPLESAGVSAEARRKYEASLVALYGEAEARAVLNNCQFLIFPNLAIFDFNVRVIQPISADRTEVYSYPVLLDGVDDSINANHMLDAQTRVGSAGMLSADDIDIFAGNQNALKATGLRWVTLSRGLGLERMAASGVREGAYSDETPQRAFWRKWARCMTDMSNGEAAGK
ncbi:Rieske 2Fe-2S domain-containing protein [Pigmentiphaga sp. CHJ604]|uniref:aromatic ring-hydroxylating oxygenase subunit alpha n=1 Tax=Pigmentiphaga sp. CHJ604 TaxID=3081984 RepID=UPI0030D5FF7C